MSSADVFKRASDVYRHLAAKAADMKLKSEEELKSRDYFLGRALIFERDAGDVAHCIEKYGDFELSKKVIERLFQETRAERADDGSASKAELGIQVIIGEIMLGPLLNWRPPQ